MKIEILQEPLTKALSVVSRIVSTKPNLPILGNIYIEAENLIIEVKSTWTYKTKLEQNLAKQKACVDGGYKFYFMIFDGKRKNKTCVQI